MGKNIRELGDAYFMETKKGPSFYFIHKHIYEFERGEFSIERKRKINF